MSGTVQIYAAASDEGFVSLQFLVDGEELGSVITEGTCRTAWDTSAVDEGFYSVTAIASDAMGTMTSSAPVTVQVSHATPPIVSSVQVTDITASSARVVWTTDQPADSLVNYGVSTAFGSSSALDATLVTQHSTTISGLTSGATYYVRARSRSSQGLVGYSAIASFQTGVVASPYTPPPADEPDPQVTQPGTCPGSDPFAAMGGGICYGGDWYPPDYPMPGAPVSSTPSPAPSAPTEPSTGGCPGPDPFIAFGGGTCVAGNWLPPGYPTAPSGGTEGSGGGTSTPAPPATSTPVPSTGDCPGTDPFAALGGGTCVNGNWLPPGHPAASSLVPPSTTEPAPASPPPASSPGGCPGSDPFVAIPGLIGICVDGNWLPVSGVRAIGVLQLVETAGGPRWTIVGSLEYEVVGPPIPEELAVEGLIVMFDGAFTADVPSVPGAIPVYLITISAVAGG